MKTSPWLLLLSPALLLVANCGHAQEGSYAACEAAAKSGIASTAVEACTRVIESEASAKERANAYSFRAGALQFLGRRKEAVSDLDASVRLAPGDAAMLANRGAIYNIQGELELAVRDLDAALQLDPNNALALGNRGIVHEKHGEWDQARTLVDRALAIEPEAAPLWGERCWIGAVSAPDPAAALPDCDRAVEKAAIPNNFNSRGLARYRAGKFAEAIADYDRSIEGAPDVASSYYMRGMAKRAAGVPGAQEDIAKGLALEPGVPERYAGYGVPAK
jgi:tetratricopeptide (TPR) repeat protein